MPGAHGNEGNGEEEKGGGGGGVWRGAAMLTLLCSTCKDSFHLQARLPL